ncbi:MAG TPA: diaminopimelate epimerase [Acidimicrobiia bacterium]|nr:diaminopimelate epimerase [Acidimicrobiia bacterium]
MRAFQFTKMQGLGNDFVVLEGPREFADEEIAAICDRRFGIGADGILVVTRDDPVSMGYWNADGTIAEMCGNGLRCVARYAYDRGWAPDRNFVVLTAVGERGVRILEDGVEAELGRPRLNGSLKVDGAEYHLVDVGNPHAVTFVDDPAMADVEVVGKRIQSEFEDGTNVEFARVVDGGLELRVWERGVGETLACGTGMVAAAAVAAEQHNLRGPFRVDVRGGTATVDLRDGVAWIRGPAGYSFRGSVGER